jgi:four helix bundle protein
MNLKIYSFEKLTTWQKAKDFLIKTYGSIEKSGFPKEELFGLVGQIKRAALSVPSNIAEGSTRTGSNDRKHFLTIAYSSAIEVLNHLIISYELRFISEDVYFDLRTDLQEITAMIDALKKSW